MIATKNFLSRLSRGLALAALLLAVTVGTTYAQTTYYVSNDNGSDAFNGQSPEPQGDGVSGPFASIDVAIGAASDGDIIMIAADDEAYSNDTAEDVADLSLTFASYLEDDGELQALVADSFQVDAGSVTVNDGASTTLVFAAADGDATLEDAVLEVNSGSFTVAEGVAGIGDGGTIILGDGSITGELNFLGTTDVTYDGSGAVTAGAELPDDLDGGDLTVGVDDAVDLTFSETLNVDDLILNEESSAAGVFSFTGSADGHEILGRGSFGSAIVSANVSLGGASTAATDSIDFTNALTLSTATLTVQADADLSPAAEGDPILRINIAGNGDLDVLGSFNADQNDYSLDITTPVSSGFEGSPGDDGLTPGTYNISEIGQLEIDFINDFTVSANDAVVDASGLSTDDNGDGLTDINGDLIIEDGSVGGSGTAELILPTDSLTVSGALTVEDNAILDVNGSDVTLVADADVSGDIEDGSAGATGSLELNGSDILGDPATDNAIIGFTVAEGTAIVQAVDSINGNILTTEGTELFLTLTGASDIEGSLTLNGDMFQLGSDIGITGSVAHSSGTFDFQEFDFTLVEGDEDESNFVGQPAADISYTANGGALVFDDAGEVTTDSVAVPNVVLNETIALGDGDAATAPTGQADLVVSESFVQQHEAAGLTLVQTSTGESLTVSGTLLLQDDPFLSSDPATLTAGVLILDDVAVTLDEPIDDEVRNSRIRFEGDATISTAQDEDGDQILDLVSLGTLQHRGGEVSIGANSFLVANTGVAVTGGSVTGDGDFEIRGGDITLAADYSVAHLRIDPGAATVTVVEDPAAADSPDRTLTVPTVLWLETGVLDVDLATLVVSDGATIHREAGELAVTTDADADTEDGSIQLGEMLTVLYGRDFAGTITTGLELKPSGVAAILVETDVLLDTSTTVQEELKVAASLSANGDATDDDDDAETVTLADNATLTLSQDGDVVGDDLVVIEASYDLTYLNYATVDTISVEEFPLGADVDTLTVNQAGEVADSDSLVLDQARVDDNGINTLVLAAGTFDLDGLNLELSGNLTYEDGELASDGAEARIVFTGSETSEFDVSAGSGGVRTLPENINVELDKSGLAEVQLIGGSLSLADTVGADEGSVLYLNGGLFVVEGDDDFVKLFQRNIDAAAGNVDLTDEALDQGFEQNSDSSYVVGNVRKSITNIPSTGSFAGAVIFPVGDSTGSYSPFRYTFDQVVNEGVVFGTDVTVDFELGEPGGSNGFPLTATASNGTDFQINGYEDFFWDVVATNDVPDEASYDVEAVRDGYSSDSTTIQRLRLVRRSGDEVEPGTFSNEFMIVGDSYDNFEEENDVHVVALDAMGGISRAGSVYSFGIQEGNQVGNEEPPVANLPTEFALNGNFPNPFRSATTISFDLPKAAAVNVQVIDILGRTVRAIDAGMVEPGAEKRIQIDASGLSSGVYFYRITAELGDQTKVETGKMTLVK